MSAIWRSISAPYFARHHGRPDGLFATPVRRLQSRTLQIGEQIRKFVAKMFGQFPIGIIAIVPIDKTDQLRFEFTGNRCQTMITQLPLGITIAQIETFEKNRFHISGEYGGGRRGVFQQQVTTVDQVAVAALMICMEELIVDAPAIVDQKCIEIFAQKLDRLLITSAWKNAVDGSYRRSPPPRATTDVHPLASPIHPW